MATEDLLAPEGMIWVCAACGKTSKHRYGDDPHPTTPGWDVSCAINCVLVKESGLVRNKSGRVVEVVPPNGS